MITPDRFIARSSDRVAWLEARRNSISATTVAKACTPAGFQQVVADMTVPREIVPNDVMRWGVEREPFIAQRVKELTGIMPNDWLISYDAGTRAWMTATPDGLSLDHKWIGEYKTSGKPLDQIPVHYLRQVQWQLHVTGAERCLFAYELRLERDGKFYPGIDIETQWVDRDEKMIRELVAVAEQLQQNLVYRDWDEMQMIESEWGEAPREGMK